MGVLTWGTSYHAALRRHSALLVEISARPPQGQWHLIRHTKGGSRRTRRSEPCTQADQRELRVQRPQWKESWTNRDWRTGLWGQAGNSLLQTHRCSTTPARFLTLLMHLSQYSPRLFICRPSGWDKGPFVETVLRQRLEKFWLLQQL